MIFSQLDSENNLGWSKKIAGMNYSPHFIHFEWSKQYHTPIGSIIIELNRFFQDSDMSNFYGLFFPADSQISPTSLEIEKNL